MKQVVGAIEKFSFSMSCDTYSYVGQPSSYFLFFTVRRYEAILSIVIFNVPGYNCSSNYKLAVLMSIVFFGTPQSISYLINTVQYLGVTAKIEPGTLHSTPDALTH